jgi:hypothetical protein
MILRTWVGGVVLAGAALCASGASARTEIHPYLQAQQVFGVDLSGNDDGSDVVTYTGVGAGVDATFDEKKLKGQIDYQYLHYFAWNHGYRDSDVHNGLGSLIYQLNPDLSLQAAGIAARTRGAFGGGSPGLLFGDANNTTQVFAAQIGPSWQHRFGDLTAQADYRFGWTRSNNGVGSFDLGPGLPVLQNSFTTISHTADVSIGTRPGGLGLPFGWRVTGGWMRDEVHLLDGRYDDKFVRGDVTVPVSPTVALLGGVGYERGKATEQQLLVDASGSAVLDEHRHLQGDPSKPRLLAYDEDGLIWDVGVLWRPSQRTSLEAHAGRRYGGTIVYGSFNHRLSPTESIQVVAYDDLDSFGRQLTTGIGTLPSDFSTSGSPLASSIAGCSFGANGGAGVCLPALNGVTGNFYKSWGVYGVWSGDHGRWAYGVSVGYDHRRYLGPDGTTSDFAVNGATEQSVYANGTLTRKLSPVSSANASVYAAWYKTGAFNSATYTSYGVIGTYNRTFSRRINGSASLGISSGGGTGATQDDVIGTALLALRYQL